VIGGVTGVVGTLMALEALKIVTGLLGESKPVSEGVISSRKEMEVSASRLNLFFSFSLFRSSRPPSHPPHLLSSQFASLPIHQTAQASSDVSVLRRSLGSHDRRVDFNLDLTFTSRGRRRENPGFGYGGLCYLLRRSFGGLGC